MFLACGILIFGCLRASCVLGESLQQQQRRIGYRGGVIQPELSIDISQLASHEGRLLGVVEPKVKWSTNGKLLDKYDVEGGWEVLIHDKKTLLLWPSSVWAKVQRAFRAKGQDYEVGARLQAHALSDQVDLDLFGKIGDSTWLQVQASTSEGAGSDPFSLSTSVLHRKKVDHEKLGSGTAWVHPHLQLSRHHQHQAKLQVGFERKDDQSTTVQLDAWSKGRGGLKLSASRLIDATLRVSPFVSTEGRLFGLQVQRGFPERSGGGMLDLTIQPTESIQASWKEGAWTVRLDAPFFAAANNKASSSTDSGIRLGIHRSVDLFI